jgi:hypothetical protein
MLSLLSSIFPLLTVWLLLIHAENFMTGLKVVFDRERSVLGWHEFDCKFIIIALIKTRKRESLQLIDQLQYYDRPVLD